MFKYFCSTIVLGGVALLLGPVSVASATWILIDDFNDLNDEGWTQGDNLTTAGPRIVDADNGSYHLQSTGPTNRDGESSLWSVWNASADPGYSEGFVRAIVRSGSTGGVTGPVLRLRTPPESPFVAYAFLGDPYTSQFFIVRCDYRFGSWEEYYVQDVMLLPGEDWMIEGGVVGDLLSMKVWRDGEPEPAQPQLTRREPNPLPDGLLGVTSFIDGRSPPVRVDATFDDIYFHPPVPGDFNSDRVLDVEDINLLTDELIRPRPRYRPQFDLNKDKKVDGLDHEMWVRELKHTWFGDADLNDEFDSNDFVQVFQAGKYETALGAGWAEGDWDASGAFGSSDFVVAFQDGGYEQGPRTDAPAVPEPAAWTLLVIGLSLWLFGGRTRSAV